MSARLDVSGLWVFRGSNPVLRDLQLIVEAGELVLITGANGSGKSTLLECVAGVLRPGAGEVRVDGMRIDGAPADRIARSGVCLVHQQRRLFATMTVRENVELSGFAARTRALEPVGEVLERFGVARLADTAAGLLSGGEQRLVALARGLRSQPRLLLLDEPLAALAPEVRDQLVAEVQRVAAAGAAVVVVEHDQPRIEPVADRVLAMRMGRLAGVPATATA